MQTIFGRASQISIAAAALLGISTGLHAQNFPITANQKATATQVAQTGVPLADLAPNAPDEYTVKRGDTLWAISGMFLRSPWRWPELWGMNLQDIRNPHLIYPGQQLYLDKTGGRATLRTRRAGGPPSDVIRVSPRTRYEALADSSIPTLNIGAIEAFLAEPLIVDEATFSRAPRIVGTQEGRVLLSRGDRAYARAEYSGGVPTGTTLTTTPGQPLDFRVFRNATPIKDPTTQQVIGYEAQYVGKAELIRSESSNGTDIVPATIDIVATKEEMRTGDRLIPEPPREVLSYVPRPPSTPITGQIASVYGNGVQYAGVNNVVLINRGTAEGVERGHVLAILKKGERRVDATDSSRPMIKLPDERNGLLMVFRTFEHLSYALILQGTDGVQVGDSVQNPN